MSGDRVILDGLDLGETGIKVEPDGFPIPHWTTTLPARHLSRLERLLRAVHAPEWLIDLADRAGLTPREVTASEGNWSQTWTADDVNRVDFGVVDVKRMPVIGVEGRTTEATAIRMGELWLQAMARRGADIDLRWGVGVRWCGVDDEWVRIVNVRDAGDGTFYVARQRDHGGCDDAASENTTKEDGMDRDEQLQAERRAEQEARSRPFTIKGAGRAIDTATEIPKAESSERATRERAIEAMRRILSLLLTTAECTLRFDRDRMAMIIESISAEGRMHPTLRAGDVLVDWHDTEAIKAVLEAVDAPDVDMQAYMTVRGDLAHLRRALVAAKPALEAAIAIHNEDPQDWPEITAEMAGRLGDLLAQMRVLPAHDTGRVADDHEHSWQPHPYVGTGPDQSKTCRTWFCGCGALQIQLGENQPATFLLESEARLLESIGDEFAKDRVRRAEDRAAKAEEQARMFDSDRTALRQMVERRDRRISALERDAEILVRHLSGQDPAWWVEAAAALGRLDQAVNPRDAAPQEPPA